MTNILPDKWHMPTDTDIYRKMEGQRDKETDGHVEKVTSVHVVPDFRQEVAEHITQQTAHSKAQHQLQSGSRG